MFDDNIYSLKFFDQNKKKLKIYIYISLIIFRTPKVNQLYFKSHSHTTNAFLRSML